MKLRGTGISKTKQQEVYKSSMWCI